MDSECLQPELADGQDEWRDLTLYGLLVRGASRWPDNLALVTAGERITYRALLDRVDRLSLALARVGVQSSDRVATLFAPNAEWVILSYAVNRLGALLAPLNIRFKSKELSEIFINFGITVLVTMDRYGRHDLFSRVAHACPELDETEMERMPYDANHQPRLTIVLSPEQQRYRNTFDFATLASQESTARELVDCEFGRIKPDDPAAVILTSGTSGRPKGVLLSHSNLIGHAHYLSRMLDIKPCDRYMNLLPFFHIAGYAQSVIMNHYAGSALVLPPSFTPDDVLAAFELENITAWAGMPVTVGRVLDFAARERKSFATIRKMHGVSPDLIERVRREIKVEIMTRMYGLSESAGLVTMIRIREGGPGNIPSCVGVPLPGVIVQIVDPETGRRLETGEIGEITFKGWNLFWGYLNIDGDTGVIDRDTFFHTGDCGFLDVENCLHFLGRYKEIIKTGGENVSQVEVERFIQDNVVGVRAVFVLGVPDKTWGEVVTAIIEPEEDANLTPEYIHSVCGELLASFKRPKHILWMSSGGWPQTGAGKVDMKALREWACRELDISITSL